MRPILSQSEMRAIGMIEGSYENLILVVVEFVKYRIYVQWKRGRSGTINNKIRRELTGDTMQDDLEQ